MGFSHLAEAALYGATASAGNPTKDQKYKTRLGGGSVAQISTMDGFIASLPSPVNAK
ncbi:hypothetical protein [Mesorhizobium sp. B2-3-10]|uniref:hypothetical protein n=1 Tax=Mesorhizobium sp. B2-3-10 TaxID=2589954 RepID=UPI0015E279A1|nr:hypothetical protein [Mesorhizobium sp. B2-3-10]